MTRLKRVSCSSPGIARKGHGRGFSYAGPRGRPVTDEATLSRIQELAIPPAWKDVWICTEPLGHLQASGIDAAGRRQYLYHPEWRERRDTQKFRRIERFAEALPDLRRRIARDLALDDMPRERTLACAVRMLDEASFRIGSESYAEQNGSFGLATMRKRHVTVESDQVVFDYEAKSGKRRHQVIRDPDAIEILRLLAGRTGGGRELLAYRDDEEGRWRDIRSSDINEYLKETAGDGFTAKDFRTWQGTVLAAVRVAGADPEVPSGRGRQRAIREVVRDVADYLGNTPAVSRSSYIDPRVFERFEEGITIAVRLREPAEEDLEDARLRTKIEAAVLALLRGELRANAKAA